MMGILNTLFNIFFFLVLVVITVSIVVCLLQLFSALITVSIAQCNRIVWKKIKRARYRCCYASATVEPIVLAVETQLPIDTTGRVVKVKTTEVRIVYI